MKPKYTNLATWVLLLTTFSALAQRPSRITLHPDPSVLAWESKGIVSYTDDYFSYYGSQYATATWEVEIEECTTLPGLFRLVNPYAGNCPYFDEDYMGYMYIDAQDADGVYIEEYYTGIDCGRGKITLSSQAFDFLSRDLNSLDELKKYGYTGKFRDGKITFPASSLYIRGTADNYPMATNQNGKWEVRFNDAKEYNVKLSGNSCALSDSYQFDISHGADGQVKYIFGRGEVSTDSFDDVMESGIIASGDQMNITLEEGYGKYFVKAIVIGDDGKISATDYLVFYYIEDNPDDWKDLGKVNYNDGFIGSIYSISEPMFEVQLQEHKSTPGYYRIVNPYDEALSGKKGSGHDHNHYIYIHAETPAQVWIEESPIGRFFNEDLRVCSHVARLLSQGTQLSQIDVEEFGIMEDNVITFPRNTLLLGEGNNDKWEVANYTMEYDTQFRLWLPNGNNPGYDPNKTSFVLTNATITNNSSYHSLSNVVFYSDCPVKIADINACMEVFKGSENIGNYHLNSINDGNKGRIFVDMTDHGKDPLVFEDGQQYTLQIPAGALVSDDGENMSNELYRLSIFGKSGLDEINYTYLLCSITDNAAVTYKVPVGAPVEIDIHCQPGWEVKHIWFNLTDDDIARFNGKKYVTAPIEEYSTVAIVTEFVDFLYNEEGNSSVEINDYDLNLKAYSENGEIKIENLKKGDTVAVFTLGGTLIDYFTATESNAHISLTPEQTYIVTVYLEDNEMNDRVSFKMLVK